MAKRPTRTDRTFENGEGVKADETKTGQAKEDIRGPPALMLGLWTVVSKDVTST